MKTQIDRLGKVAVTVDKDYWDITKDYDKLVVVEREGDCCYLSRKPVPAGTLITNREYWIKFSSSHGGGGGGGISQNFGYDPDISISQKTLTESRDNIQSQIDAIVSDKATVSISSSTNTFIVGEKTFTLTATSNTDAESIIIKQGSNIIASGDGKTLAKSITVSQTTAGSIVYTAEFTFAGGAKKTATVTVYFVNKIYAGAGSVYTAVTNDAHALSEAKRSAAGTYNITIAQNGQYVFFVIPSTMSISKATMSGFDFPLDAATMVTVDGVSYKSYRSSNTYDAGSYQIILT